MEKKHSHTRAQLNQADVLTQLREEAVQGDLLKLADALPTMELAETVEEWVTRAKEILAESGPGQIAALKGLLAEAEVFFFLFCADFSLD